MEKEESRYKRILQIFIFISMMTISPFFAGSSGGSEEQQILSIDIDDEFFFSQLHEGVMIGEVLVVWTTECQPRADVSVSVYLGRDGSGWNAVASEIFNEGEFYLDPMGSKVENGDGYGLRILATTADGRFTDSILDGKFSIDIDRSMGVRARILNETENVTGPLEIEWEVTGEFTLPLEVDLDLLCEFDRKQVFDANITIGTYRACIETADLSDEEVYLIRLNITDSENRTCKFEGLSFTVSGYRPAVPGLTGIFEDDIIWQPRNIGYVPHPNPTKWDLFRTDLFFTKKGSVHRIYLFRDDNETRDIEFEPSRFEQGSYVMTQVSRGNAFGYRFTYSVNFTICDGTIPIIDKVMCTSGVVDASIQMVYKMLLRGPSSYDSIRLRISYMDEEGTWVDLADDLPHSGKLVADTSGVPTGNHLFRVRSYNRYAPSIFTEALVENVRVYHNDPPSLRMVSHPEKGEMIVDEIYLSWFATDPDGDRLSIDVYYRFMKGDWIHLSTYNGSGSGFAVWNISEIESGPYEVRVVAREVNSEGLFTTQVPPEFNITGSEKQNIMVGGRGERTILGFTPEIFILLLAVILMILFSITIFIIYRRRTSSREREAIPENMDTVSRINRDDVVSFGPALPAMGCTSNSGDGDVPAGGGFAEVGSVEDLIDIIGSSGDDEVCLSDMDSYRILGLPMNASEESIRSAYMAHVRKYHPDRFHHISEHLRKKAEESLARKNRAKDILLDHRKRAILDRMIRENEKDMIREMGLNVRKTMINSEMH